jgi:AcrR family transcriptional regulator
MTSVSTTRTGRPTPTGAPRTAAPLTREGIVEAALALVGDESLAGLTTRRLGRRLGCQAMSIYHHFPSKQHLLDALVGHAIASVEVPEPGPDVDMRLRLALDSYRAMARRWPALFPLVAVHRLDMPAGVRFIESVLRLIHSATGDDELTARQFRVLGDYIVGAGIDETAGYARGPSAAEPVDAAFIARECPRLAAAAPFFQPAHRDATWQSGIDALLERGRKDAQAQPARAATPPRRARGRGSAA